MCGRFNQHKINLGGPDGKYESKLTRKLRNQKRANISAGMVAEIITNEGLQASEFGFRPGYDPSKLFINARVEGKNNPMNLKQGWDVGITKVNTFVKSYFQGRCIIPVNSFIEGPEKEKLSKPYLIKCEDDRVFYLAGIHRTYIDKEGDEVSCFAILTQPAIPVCEEIGHHRSPVLLYEDCFDILTDPQIPIDQINEFLKAGYYEPDMESHPLNPALIKSGKLHDPEILAEFREGNTGQLF